MMARKTRIVENTWNCTTCQHKNLGRHMKCENCGIQKGKDVTDTVPQPNAAPTVTDPELLKLANQKENWICEYCGGQTRDERGKCQNCAATREALKRDAEAIGGDWKKVGDDLRSAAKKHWEVLGSSDGPTSGVDRWSSTLPPMAGARTWDTPKKPVPAFVWLIILAVAIAIIGALIFFLMPFEVAAKVSKTEWQYVASLHQRETRHSNGWGHPFTVTPINIACENKYYGEEDCHPYDCRPHQVSYDCNCESYECNCRETCRDNKNGFSTCSETCSTCRRCSTCSKTEYDTCYESCPVYKDWCEYDYYEWPETARQATSGSTLETYWPELKAYTQTQRLDVQEKYSVEFELGKRTWTLTPKTLDEFKKYAKGSTWKLRTNRLSNAADPLAEVK